MSNQGTVKAAVIGGAILLAAAIYFAPKNPPVKKTDAGTVEATPDFARILEQAKNKLLPQTLARISDFEKQTASSLPAYDSIAKVWDNERHPEIAAYYFEQKAQKDNSEQSFLNAAYRYFDGFRAAPDSITRNLLAQKAIACYEKVISINPNNLNAKTDLGICYAEATANPMKGIMMLREVITQNPDHENAQLNLGFLSVKSGQYEKAIERFNTVLKINPSHIEAYIFLAQTYSQMGDNKKAIENFEKFKSLTTDNSLITEVDRYIEELKKQPQ